jgi:hypothetical protein
MFLSLVSQPAPSFPKIQIFFNFAHYLPANFYWVEIKGSQIFELYALLSAYPLYNDKKNTLTKAIELGNSWVAKTFFVIMSIASSS